MNQKQWGFKHTAENSGIFLRITELPKSVKREKERSTYHTDPDIRAKEWQIPLLSPIHFHFSELPYGTPHPSERQKAERVRQRESQTHRERGRESEGGISPGVEMEGTVAAVHPRQYLLKSNPLLHVCLQHRGKRQRKQSDPLTHSPQKERETGKQGEGEGGRITERERNIQRERQGKKTSELVRRPRQLENSRFKFSAFPLLCRRAEWEGTSWSF